MSFCFLLLLGWCICWIILLNFQKGPTFPLGFKEQERFPDIDMFHHDQAPAPKRARTTAEVPDLFSSLQLASYAGFYKTVGARQSRRAHVELLTTTGTNSLSVIFDEISEINSL